MDNIEVINRLKEVKNFKTNQQLADYLEIPLSILSYWRFKSIMDFELILSDLIQSKFKGLNLNWVFTGKGERFLSNIEGLNKRLKDIEGLNKEDIDRIYYLVDLLIKDAKKNG